MVCCPDNLWNQDNWEHQKKTHTLLGGKGSGTQVKEDVLILPRLKPFPRAHFRHSHVESGHCLGQHCVLCAGAPAAAPGAVWAALCPDTTPAAPDHQQTQQLCTPALPALIFLHWWESSGLQVLCPQPHTPSTPPHVLGIINPVWENKKQIFLIPPCSSNA